MNIIFNSIKAYKSIIHFPRQVTLSNHIIINKSSHHSYNYNIISGALVSSSKDIQAHDFTQNHIVHQSHESHNAPSHIITYDTFHRTHVHIML